MKRLAIPVMFVLPIALVTDALVMAACLLNHTVLGILFLFLGAALWGVLGLMWVRRYMRGAVPASAQVMTIRRWSGKNGFYYAPELEYHAEEKTFRSLYPDYETRSSYEVGVSYEIAYSPAKHEIFWVIGRERAILGGYRAAAWLGGAGAAVCAAVLLMT